MVNKWGLKNSFVSFQNFLGFFKHFQNIYNKTKRPIGKDRSVISLILKNKKTNSHQTVLALKVRFLLQKAFPNITLLEPNLLYKLYNCVIEFYIKLSQTITNHQVPACLPNHEPEPAIFLVSLKELQFCISFLMQCYRRQGESTSVTGRNFKQDILIKPGWLVMD